MLSMCCVIIEDLTAENIGDVVIKARNELDMLYSLMPNVDPNIVKARYYESVPYNEEQTKILKEIVESDLFVIPSFVYETIFLKQRPNKKDDEFIYTTINSILFDDEECKVLYKQVRNVVEKYGIVNVKDRLQRASTPEMIGRQKMLYEVIGSNKTSEFKLDKTIKCKQNVYILIITSAILITIGVTFRNLFIGIIGHFILFYSLYIYYKTL